MHEKIHKIKPQLAVSKLSQEVAINSGNKIEKILFEVHYCIPYQCMARLVQIPRNLLHHATRLVMNLPAINGIYGNSQAHYFYFSHVHVSRV